jgi:hypothetical protein
VLDLRSWCCNSVEPGSTFQDRPPCGTDHKSTISGSLCLHFEEDFDYQSSRLMSSEGWQKAGKLNWPF